MRPVLVLSLIALAAFASGVGYFMRTAIESGDSMAPVAQPAETPVPTIQPANSALQIRMVTLRESSPEYSIDVVYPQLGLSFDSEIRDLFDESSAQIRNLARDYPPDSVSPGPYTLASTLHSVYVDPDVVSIRLSIYSYTGGAHGGSATFGFNLNRDSGTELTIDEALSLIGLSISEVADQALRQFESGTRLRSIPGWGVCAPREPPDICGQR